MVGDGAKACLDGAGLLAGGYGWEDTRGGDGGGEEREGGDDGARRRGGAGQADGAARVRAAMGRVA